MSGSSNSETSVEPNLTPMLDLVFQLITFFMLVINFKAATMDLTLKLPVLGSARPVDTQGTEELLVLNINTEGQLNVYGIPRDVEPYIKSEARASRTKAKAENAKFGDKDDLPDTVVIRADRGTVFKKLNVVIKTCQDNGFRKFALKAMDKVEE